MPVSAIVLPPHARRRVFIGLLLAMFLGALDQSIVGTALPIITTELGGLNHLTWVVTSFMLTSTISAPIYGKLSDMYGRRPLFAFSVILFIAASMLCGAAHSMQSLIASRALQGLAAGGLMMLTQASIASIVPPDQRARYQGIFTGTFAMSSVVGPLLGGLLTTHLTWRAIFFINLPLGVVSLVLVLASMPNIARRTSHAIDYAGAALITVGTSALLLFFNAPVASSHVAGLPRVALLPVTLLAFILLLFVERRAREPIINLDLFRITPYWICVSASGVMAFAMMGALVFLPLYFQLVLHQTPTESGAMILPQVAMMLVTAVGGGRIASTRHRIVLVLTAGVALECCGLTLLAILAHRGAGVHAFLVAMAVLGAGMGMGMSSATVIVQNAVSEAVRGTATATMSFVRSLGATLGIALSGGVMHYVLSQRVAALASVVHVGDLLDRGLDVVAALPASQQLLLIDGYRNAIGACLQTGAIAMALGFCLVLSLSLVPSGREDSTFR